MMRRYAGLPDLPSGYPLDDSFAVVVPIARTNMVTNPSFELGTIGVTPIGGGGHLRSATNQYHGAYSCLITSGGGLNDGVYQEVSLVSGTLYAFSCKVFRVNAGVPLKIFFASSGGAELAVYPFRSTGRWQWVWVYYTATSTATHRVCLSKDNNSSTAFTWTDGWQCEALTDASETVSTYIDGDQVGLVPNQQPPAFIWLGTPHASTSQRSGLTRAGGMVVRLKDYSFLLTAIVGLGLALPQNVKTDYARLDGAYDDYTRKPVRQFTLTGRLSGRSYQELRDVRSQIARLLDRDRVGLDQRLLLLHQIEGQCGDVQTSITRVYGKYQDGLGGNTDNQVGENAAISFEQYLPYVQADGEDGGQLTVQTSLGNADGIFIRSPSGAWSKPGTGAANGAVFALMYGQDGSLYAGGSFTGMGGVANTSRIAKWDGTSWTALGTGAANNSVSALAIGPDGSLYAGGNFTAMGGVADTANIAKWNGSAWVSIATGGANGAVTALAFSPNGTLYAGGLFTTIGGTAANRIASYNGSAWSALGTGANAIVAGLVVGPGPILYATGGFTSMGGVANTIGIAKWNGSAWSEMAGGMTGTDQGTAIVVGPNGKVYVTGTFTVIGGLSINRIAQWNGTAWQPMGTGFGNQSGLALIVLPNGTVLAGGSFTTAGGIALPDSIALWNGSVWVYVDITLTNFGSGVFALAQKNDGTLAVGFTVTATTSIAAAQTTITNTGTGRTYPTIKIIGPSTGTSRIFQIINYTTGRAVYLNLTMTAGETVLLNFQPDFLSFTSTFQGNVASTILPGSNEADFFLQPGNNVISLFAAVSTVGASTYWRPAFVSLDDVP